MRKIELHTPLDRTTRTQLQSGDQVLLSGTIYTARDAAHQRLIACLEQGEAPPFELAGAIIYYAGPAPTPPGLVTGAIGPTTSGRMDSYTPRLLTAGLAGMIGKGKRGPAVRASIQQNSAVYFAALGGAAALLAKTVRSMEVIAWPELGAEAVRRLEVAEMPLIVINDTAGHDLYEEACATV